MKYTYQNIINAKQSKKELSLHIPSLSNKKKQQMKSQQKQPFKTNQ